MYDVQFTIYDLKIVNRKSYPDFTIKYFAKKCEEITGYLTTVLSGKKSNRSIKVGDCCRARIIAVSYKDPNNPKIGLTMRQEGLGRTEWLAEDAQPKEAPAEKEEKAEKPKKKSKE